LPDRAFGPPPGAQDGYRTYAKARHRPGRRPDCAEDAATLIPKSAADIANALNQAVFGYMHLRPNGLKQHVLSECPSSVFGKNTQKVEGFFGGEITAETTPGLAVVDNIDVSIPELATMLLPLSALAIGAALPRDGGRSLNGRPL